MGEIIILQWFSDGEMSWVGDSPNDISGPRNPQNVKFGTNHHPRMMRALKISGKLFLILETPIL